MSASFGYSVPRGNCRSTNRENSADPNGIASSLKL
jgi:hypothetical protein